MLNNAYNEGFSLYRGGISMPTYDIDLRFLEIPSWYIVSYGLQNNYPQIVRSAVDNSPTAFGCVKHLSSFLSGNGFEVPQIGQAQANSSREPWSKILRQVCRDVAYFNGYALQLSLNPYGEVIEVRNLPFQMIRKGFGYVEDSFKSKNGLVFGGKELGEYAAIFDNWGGETWRLNSPISPAYFYWFPFWDPNFDVNQFNDFTEYSTAIYYVSFDDNIYPKAHVHPAIQDALSDNGFSVFTQKNLSNGFVASHIIHKIGQFETEEERDKFVAQFRQHQGVDNAGNLVFVAGGGVIRDADGNIKPAVQIEPLQQPDVDKLFLNQSERTDLKIGQSFGIPDVMLNTAKAGIFNKQSMAEAIEYYNHHTEPLRRDIAASLLPILAQQHGLPLDFDLKIRKNAFDLGVINQP